MNRSLLPLDSNLALHLDGSSVWISGARGFIGAALAADVRAHGATVVAFDGDIRHPDEVRQSILSSKPQRIYNLAAVVDVSRNTALDAEMKSTLFDGACAVLDAAEQMQDPPVVVQCGTCEEYGTIEAPFAEESPPSEPVSPYARWKLAATQEVLRRTAEGRVSAVVARPFLTYGPTQSGPQLVPAALDAALTGSTFCMTSGRQTRELNYIADTARGLLRSSVVEAIRGQIVNIASGDEHRVLDIVRLIFELAGAPEELIQVGALPDRPGEVARFVAETTRCRQILGHEAQVPLVEGLQRCLASRIQTHKAL